MYEIDGIDDTGQFVYKDLNNDGDVKILDFGIAKNLDTSSAEYTMTGTSQMMGTPMYMSPEQIKSTKDITIQTDIYSLGVVLWNMATGTKPYNQNTLSSSYEALKSQISIYSGSQHVIDI